MEAQGRSVKGLDWVSLLMADVKDGVGVYLSVFLLTVRRWEPDEIGIVIAAPGIVGILVQAPAGALIDRTTYKRWLLVGASLIIAACCLVVVLSTGFTPILVSQLVVGLTQSVYAPCVAAITLGIVGHSLLAQRIGRNESCNHLGNMLAAIAAGLIGRFISYEGIFYFSIAQCLALVAAVFIIREQDIDHCLARGAEKDEKEADAAGVKTLLSNRKILVFTVAMALFHLANGAMLPLVGQKMGLVDPQNSSLYLSAAIIIAQGVMVFVANYAGRAAENGRKKVLVLAYLLLPVRALLFAFIDNPYALTAIQLLDGIGAGLFGVLSILMIADLSKGTGRFNLLQGVVYSAIGLAAALSSILGGFVVKHFGYPIGFASLAAIGGLGLLFYWFFVPETKDSSTDQEIEAVEAHASAVPQ
ncbi:MFS transporter [Hymenobacter chitinivorans]|uniref:Putative MFS family arabinose efflux permease n=1 Tax=Hymenobacter chitinivorans DSM 11115 TaxID=1121954 RepID=A0A2M9BPY2_9BACT|nr:MFS transporter [Hymenobacter chitinivorans]PJJ60019.1 putative MFS family arabinose efflux permease [Hymenobacter chitinivorans DSM 11115]